jgi:hypothetical protein
LPCKPFEHYAQEMGISEWTVRTAATLLKLWPYKITVVLSLHKHDQVISITAVFSHFINGKLDLELIFSSHMGRGFV